MQALARKAGKGKKKALELWGKAQAAANKQYPKLKAAKGKGGEQERRYYKVVTAIFKNMLGLGKEESEQSDPIIAEVLCHTCRSTTEVFLYPHNVGVCGECGSVHITPTGEVHYATQEEIAAADPALLEAVSIGTPPDMMLKWNVMEAVVWTDGRAEANKVKKALGKHFGHYKQQGMLGGLIKGGKVSESGFKAQVVVNPNVTPDRFLGGLKDAIRKTGLQLKGHAYECKELGTVEDLKDEIERVPGPQDPPRPARRIDVA
jgi:ribosomal protein S27E